MELERILITLAIITIVACQLEHDSDNDTKKALASERDKARSANPGREKGSFQKLNLLNRNRTHERGSRRRAKENFNKIRGIHREHKPQNDGDMLNDNEGVISNLKTLDNDTNTLTSKIKELRKEDPTYEAVNKHTYVPRITGVYCNFENSTNPSGIDMCMWRWNSTVSSHGLGFSVATAADVEKMNQSKGGMKFSGPAADADGNFDGHFLYLPVDPTMENMVIKSPPFRGLWEFCKFEAWFHQSKMQNGSIRLISESTTSGVQWILQEVAGNNFELWHSMTFMIGRVHQEIRIIIEITRPAHVSVAPPLPHVAIDNVRMVECLPEPPVYDGNCQEGQLKCLILGKESCIKRHQICDLVKDCDDGSDERQNCDKMPIGSYCNFEHDDCGFQDIPQPILKWVRHSGPTPTDKTGPNFDHTCGPPDFYPTQVVIPPLSPAHMNYSISRCVGFYYFVNMNVTGPNKEKADFASSAIMKTVVFNPPPRVHGNITSKYYNCCTIRFYYQQNGRNYGSLSVDVVELTNRGNITTSLLFSTKDKGENWYRASIFLPNITRRYFFLFKTRMGMRIYSDTAIDDFSMSPECFGLNVDPAELGDYNYYDPQFEESTTPHEDFEDKPVYRFTTCGATGRFGPNQTMCDAAYRNTSVTVSVAGAPYQGIQAWEVPEEGYYTIIAHGASGGLGSARAGVSHAAMARALVELHRGEVVYLLVGQQGTHACKKTLSARERPDCARPWNSSALFTSKTHEVRNTRVEDGGGGGGGATYVFVKDESGAGSPLLVAAGGGGLSVGVFRDDGSQHARAHTNATPESGYMYGPPGETSGAGGGWSARGGMATPGHERVRGQAAREGGAGGEACRGGAHGGYGGGGGACVRGGAGGGYVGGHTNQGEHGGGGHSYIDPRRAVRELSRVAPAQHMGPGEVVIVPAIHGGCGCDYRCIALNEYMSDVQCFCPSEWSIDAHDSTKCISHEKWTTIHWITVGGGFVLGLVLVTGALLICLLLYSNYQRKAEASRRRKRLAEQELQLRRLRAAPAGLETRAARNPHYGADTLPGPEDPRMPQLARESLKLVKALGQGAFGEVYQGLYRHRANDEMPVAVKTLPEMSTEQAEKDFCLEAGLMFKFNHPNVVHLIGVCFDRHPRFIVLELLSGGDLKNFLRESRPRAGLASALTMKDLLLCALDVCRGCRYMETMRFIHRDIAARNCLLTCRGPGRVVKIADFGMARDIYRSDYYKKGGKAMLPIKWMPIEAFMDGIFTVKTDVWSFAVLLWEVFSLGMMPYTGCSNREVMEMVTGGGRLERPAGCPPEVYRLMCECWKPEPEERPTFVHMFDRLQLLLLDPEIVNAPLPVMKTLLPAIEDNGPMYGPQRAGDYLVPLTPGQNADPSSTAQLTVHSSPPPGLTDADDEDSQYQLLQKASQGYGNIPGESRGRDEAATEGRSNKFLQSNSTDRLLSSTEEASIDDEVLEDDKPAVWETSFTQPAAEEPGPPVDKLISITPTSPKPPDNPLTKAMESIIDKTGQNHLCVDQRLAPIASPDPPRINSWSQDKAKPLCLDAQLLLEQNLSALKKTSGSVNLNTMNVLPPYINVVTPNKLSEAKTIQIDPKKAVIHDLQSPKANEEDKGKMKQSNSVASLLNGPMPDVPYADSDTTSSSGSNPSGSNHVNATKSKKKNYAEVKVGVTKQGSNASEFLNDSEISC